MNTTSYLEELSKILKESPIGTIPAGKNALDGPAMPENLLCLPA